MDDSERIAWLREEVRSWVEDGVVSLEEGRAILQRYGVSPSDLESTGAQRRLIAVLSVLGAVLFGAGVTLFFAANWQRISDLAKLGLVLGAIIAAYHAGFTLAFGGSRRGPRAQLYPKTGMALIFVGALLYGAGIWLVAQIYGLSPRLHEGLFLWVVGVAPLAYTVRSQAVAALAALLLCVWLGAKSADWFGFYEHGMVPIVLMFVCFGVLLYGAGRLHAGTRADFARLPLRTVGLVVVLLGLYVLSFDLLRRDFPSSAAQVGPGLRIGAIVWGLAVLAALADLLRSGGREPPRLAETTGLVAIGALAALPIAMPMVGGPLWIAVMNVALFAVVVGAIAVGYRSGEAALVDIALLAFIVHVGTRYFDIFFDLLPRALFFMGGGVLLLGGGIYLERRRRSWRRSVEGTAA